MPSAINLTRCAILAGAILLTSQTASAQIPIVTPRVGFSVTARFVVPAPGVLVVRDVGHDVALVGGAYWLHRDGVWLRARHPHHHWVVVEPPLVPVPLVGLPLRVPLLLPTVPLLKPPGVPLLGVGVFGGPTKVKLKSGRGPGMIKIKGGPGGPGMVKIKGGPGGSVKIKTGPGRDMIKVKGPGGKLDIKGPPPGQVKKGGGKPSFFGGGGGKGGGKKPKGGKGKGR